MDNGKLSIIHFRGSLSIINYPLSISSILLNAFAVDEKRKLVRIFQCNTCSTNNGA